MKLSRNFSLSEFTNSETAQRRGIVNEPSSLELENLHRVAATLEQVRDVLECPILISSGYRCRQLNEAIGGSMTSDHINGLAADFTVPQFGDAYDVAVKLSRIEGLRFDQLILEFYSKTTRSGWVHIGIGERMRQQILTVNRSGTYSGIVR